jgi:hypothetical protein
LWPLLTIAALPQVGQHGAADAAGATDVFISVHRRKNHLCHSFKHHYRDLEPAPASRFRGAFFFPSLVVQLRESKTPCGSLLALVAHNYRRSYNKTKSNVAEAKNLQ